MAKRSTRQSKASSAEPTSRAREAFVLLDGRDAALAALEQAVAAARERGAVPTLILLHADGVRAAEHAGSAARLRALGVPLEVCSGALRRRGLAGTQLPPGSVAPFFAALDDFARVAVLA